LNASAFPTSFRELTTLERFQLHMQFDGKNAWQKRMAKTHRLHRRNISCGNAALVKYIKKLYAAGYLRVATQAS
jgi:hypothetical protein